MKLLKNVRERRVSVRVSVSVRAEMTKSAPFEVEVRAGDLLFVPPQWWHHVRSLGESASLTTYSRHHGVYDHMHAVYRYEPEFDKTFVNRRIPGYILRFFLQLCIHELYTTKDRGFFGASIPDAKAFFTVLLEVRFSGLESLFEPMRVGPEWCTVLTDDGRNATPVSQNIVEASKFDKEVVAAHFEALPAQHRDVLFADYVEELVAEAVGVRQMVSYMEACFVDREYPYAYHNPHGFWQQSDDHARGKRKAWPGHALKGELMKMNSAEQ
eukprot:TRINITY_DN6921_c0_g2_i5.p1 TRINITY_DN6921_c0_g2~~TRINITY_DN6921_c0_g2_i5.p1  ORF type:complete len:269 (-),score=48.25 TRINITY_DN6921_c0_g2_i5:454-1260(-)